MEVAELTIATASRLIRMHEVTSLEIVEATLERIAAVEPALGAFSHVAWDAARDAARAADQEIAASGWRGPLHGLPIAVKDLIDVAGQPTGCGSASCDASPAGSDAECVAALVAAGAVIIGKTSLDEFAYGVTTPPTHNPWSAAHVTGGSSGGSAAAVAAGLCMGALGTDTGGSVRIPAAACGVVGLKPTYARVSTIGVVPLSWSLDVVGPLARSATDAGLLLAALDSPVAGERSRRPRSVEGLRLGIPREHFFTRVEPETQRLVRVAIERLADLGCELREVSLPFVEEIMAIEYGLCAPEASAYHRPRLERVGHLYSPRVRHLLEAGNRLPAWIYIDALRTRARFVTAWSALFEDVDLLVGPTIPWPAVERGRSSIDWPDGTEAVVSAYVRLCAPANITGFPALSVPCGITPDGLPVGLQLMTGPWRDELLLRVAAMYSDAVPRPPLA